MGYSLKFIISIAESKFGKGDRKAIDKYVAEFDPDKPEFAADILNYNLTVVAENAKSEENAFRYRILQDVRYMCIVYGKGLPGRAPDPETKEAAAKDIYRIRASFTTEPVKPEEGKKYLLHSAELQKKYGFHHKAENVVAVLKDLCARENATDGYRSYFKALFTATYCVAMDKDPDVMELFTDFDNFMAEVLKTEIAPLAENRVDMTRTKHGGLEGKELVDFLNGYASLSEPERVTGRVEKAPPEPDAVRTK